jgi:hypothetical protein
MAKIQLRINMVFFCATAAFCAYFGPAQRIFLCQAPSGDQVEEAVVVKCAGTESQRQPRHNRVMATRRCPQWERVEGPWKVNRAPSMLSNNRRSQMQFRKRIAICTKRCVS